jgi:hypothetical protein
VFTITSVLTLTIGIGACADMIRALGTSIITGRDFSSVDRTGGVPVVIINESMARWP